MERIDVILVKLGGSLITFKDKPLKANFKVIDSLTKIFKQISTPMIIVHGGGSFGHYYANKYGLSDKYSSLSNTGVMLTKYYMNKLNSLVVDSFIQSAIPSYPIAPINLFVNDKLTDDAKNTLIYILKQGITPITFGDVIISKDGYKILSGDKIMKMLGININPIRAVFIMNVDGFYYPDFNSGNLVSKLNFENKILKKFTVNKIDVTGGINTKLQESIILAKKGIDVSFVNGFKSDRVVKALLGNTFKGTIIEGKK